MPAFIPGRRRVKGEKEISSNIIPDSPGCAACRSATGNERTVSWGSNASSHAPFSLISSLLHTNMIIYLCAFWFTRCEICLSPSFWTHEHTLTCLENLNFCCKLRSLLKLKYETVTITLDVKYIPVFNTKALNDFRENSCVLGIDFVTYRMKPITGGMR